MATLPLSIQDIYDENYYRQNNPQLASLNSRELYRDFLTNGINQGLRFSPFFNVNFYRAANPDLANRSRSNRELLDQFLNSGYAEGRRFSPVFDLTYYRAANPDLAQLDPRQLFLHFRDFGVNEERKYSRFFDQSFYGYSNADLAGLSNRQLFEHIQRIGLDEGREFSPFFELDFYRASNLTSNPSLARLDNRALFSDFQLAGLDRVGRFSPFIDLDFYGNSNPDLFGLTPRQLFEHLQDVGLAQGRPFLRIFDLNYYRANNPDLAGLNNEQLLEHFQTYGLNEGRLFSPLLDLNAYRASDPTLVGLSNEQLFERFQGSGIAARTPLPGLFDVNFYRDANPDLATKTDAELRQHFQDFSLNERRKFSLFFDPEYYTTNNPDLQLAGLNRQQAIEHFERFGIDEQRPFSPYFDLQYYIDNNPDLRAAGLTRRQAFQHFINIGLNEGRRPSLIFNPPYYLANNPDLLARQLNFRQAFENFQIGEPRMFDASGFQLARPASIFFDPDTIAPLVSPPLGFQATSAPDWLQNAAEWEFIPVGGTLTYSFVTTASSFLYEGPETRIREVNDEIKNNIRNAMRQYSELIGIDLVEVPDRPPNVGRVRIMFSDGPAGRNLLGYANSPTDQPSDGTAGDIHLNPDRNAVDFSAVPGSFGYEALLFLVGAALGLNDYTAQRGQQGQGFVADLNIGKDNNTNTVMTQNFVPDRYTGSFALTPMAYDIRALQYLYGPSYLNNGDTYYSFNVNNFIGPDERNGRNGVKQTIWDSGGIDTFDFSALPVVPGGFYFDMNEAGQNTPKIALNQGVYLVNPPNTGGGDGTDDDPIRYTTSSYGTSIAFGSEIENLVGSPGDDEILGNNLPNNISAGLGNDRITGSRGQDVLNGGPGGDIFAFAPGDGGQSPAAADVINDFTIGEDRIGLALGLPFGALSITQGAGANANDTLIRIGGTGEYLAVLPGIPAAAINNIANFVSV